MLLIPVFHIVCIFYNIFFILIDQVRTDENFKAYFFLFFQAVKDLGFSDSIPLGNSEFIPLLILTYRLKRARLSPGFISRQELRK